MKLINILQTSVNFQQLQNYLYKFKSLQYPLHVLQWNERVRLF